jgi:leucyl aminopeptidase (aminopeptidase T)
MTAVSAPDLASAATTFVGTALKVKAGERVAVLCDDTSSEVGDAVTRAATVAGAEVTTLRLDQLRSVSTNHTGDRPHKVLPDVVRRAMLASQASVFVASAPHGESSMREQLVHIVGACGVRHAHMPGISASTFARAHRLDYQKLVAWGRGVERRVELARQLDVESHAGTRLEIVFGAQSRWSMHLGELRAGKSVTYPAGVLFAHPERVDGVFVANASLGEFFGSREGLLLERPVRFTLERSRVTAVDAATPTLTDDILKMLAFSPGSDRVGVVALGVNTGVGHPSGDATLDMTRPGVHLVLGDAFGLVPAPGFSARTSFAACQASCRVLADKLLLVDDGRIQNIG